MKTSHFTLASTAWSVTMAQHVALAPNAIEDLQTHDLWYV